MSDLELRHADIEPVVRQLRFAISAAPWCVPFPIIAMCVVSGLPFGESGQLAGLIVGCISGNLIAGIVRAILSWMIHVICLLKNQERNNE